MQPRIAIRDATRCTDGITETHQAMLKWFAQNQQPITGVSWELYGGWSENPAELETEICYQLK